MVRSFNFKYERRLRQPQIDVGQRFAIPKIWNKNGRMCKNIITIKLSIFVSSLGCPSSVYFPGEITQDLFCTPRCVWQSFRFTSKARRLCLTSVCISVTLFLCIFVCLSGCLSATLRKPDERIFTNVSGWV